jgi:hypothetical protein
MKRSLLITEDEKRRISNMHKKAILKEQTQSPDAGGETVNDKLYELYNQINGLLKNCTALLQGEQRNKNFAPGSGFFLKDKSAFCNVNMNGPQAIKLEIVNGTTNRPVQVGDFKSLNEKPTLSSSFPINKTAPYTSDTVLTDVKRKNQLHNGITRFVPSIAPAFDQWLTTFAPTFAEFLNAAVFAFPDKPGTATFQEWGTRDMIAGGNVPVKTTT